MTTAASRGSAPGLPTLHTRASGVLLHLTSLPGPFGSGDLGGAARAFIEFLRAADQRWWQMLPVGPAGYGNSPYSALSAFAGDPLLVSPEGLVRDGWLERQALERAPAFPSGRVDYPAARRFREGLLRQAFAAFEARADAAARAEHERFVAEQAGWLDDFTLFVALKEAHRQVQWTRWEPEVRDRQAEALARARRELRGEIAFHGFVQWQFARQWAALRRDCEGLGVALVGDVPIFVAHDSADVWARRELFQLDAAGEPTVVAGVPPDYFSATGQRWGNPLYRWTAMAERGFAWWIDRLRVTLERFHAVRLDHFIGFQRYWEIPANEPTAEHGVWEPGPGAALFDAVRDALGELPLIAEDLGAVTPEVKALRDRFGLPGLRILQFAFGDDPSAPDFKPHNYPRRTVVYTGTHDNDTTVGWFTDPGGGDSVRTPAQTELERRFAMAYLPSDGAEIHWDMIRAASASVADVSIFPAQDLLGLGAEARMNRPGQPSGNWEWRLWPGALTPELAARLRHLTRLYDRGTDAAASGAADATPPRGPRP